MDTYIGQKLSKKPTSSVRLGKIHNFSFPAVAMKQRRKRIYLRIRVKMKKRMKRIQGGSLEDCQDDDEDKETGCSNRKIVDPLKMYNYNFFPQSKCFAVPTMVNILCT